MTQLKQEQHNKVTKITHVLTDTDQYPPRDID